LFLIGSEFQGTSKSVTSFLCSLTASSGAFSNDIAVKFGDAGENGHHDHLSRVEYGETIQFSDHHRISRPELIHHAQELRTGTTRAGSLFRGKFPAAHFFT
jgi:hypothetical protein